MGPLDPLVDVLGVVYVLPESRPGLRVVYRDLCLWSRRCFTGADFSLRTSADQAAADADGGASGAGCDGGRSGRARRSTARLEALPGRYGLLPRGDGEGGECGPAAEQ